MDKKVYSGTMLYIVKEVKKFLFFKFTKYKELEFEFPHLIYAINDRAARDTIMFSDVWKSDLSTDENCYLEILEKELAVDEVSSASLHFLMFNMRDVDFVDYVKQLLAETA